MDAHEPQWDDEIPRILKTEDLARIFGISVAVARRWLTEGRIPSRKIGKRRFVRREDLLRALEPEGKRRRRPDGGT